MITDFKDIYASIERGYNICTSDGVAIVRADNLSCIDGLEHGFSTRIGGISSAPFDSLNLGLSRNEPRENILRNFRILSDSFSIDYNTFAVVNHEHGSNVLRLDKNDGGRGLCREPLPFSDGLITNDPGVTLVTAHADCSAVFLYDKVTQSIGLAHAGWKGTFKRVGQRLCERMVSEFGCDPSNIIAAIGPCICFDCFEVDAQLGEDFKNEFGYDGIVKPGRKGKSYVDIEAALAIQLLEAGVVSDHLSIMHLCTYERKDLFYSYRRDGADTGSMASFMRLV